MFDFLLGAGTGLLLGFLLGAIVVDTVRDRRRGLSLPLPRGRR